MKKIILLTAMLFSFNLQAKREFTYERFPLGDGVKRPPPKVYLPTNISEKESWPLVISLHGFYSTPIFQNAFFNAKKLVTKKGFILVVPYGQKNYLGARFWNASDYCCDFFNQKVDDIKHLKDLISSLKSKYPVDKVFLVGHSNGGFLAHRYACGEDNDISGIVSIAGAGVTNPASCNPKKGISILQVHGTKDKVIKFNGRKGKYPSAFNSIAPWAQLNGCTEELPQNYGVISKKITSTGWKDCENKNSVLLWAIEGGRHTIPLSKKVVGKIVDHLL